MKNKTNMFEILSALINANSFEDVASTLQNPDTATMRFMSYEQDNEINGAFRLLKVRKVFDDILEELDFNDSIDDLISALRESDEQQVIDFASFIESKIKNNPNLNLTDKSIPAILWATAIYENLEENSSHLGIETLQTLSEIAIADFVELIRSHYVSAPSTTIKDLREEVSSIFQNSQIKEKVEDYLKLAYVRNESWEDEDFWYDFDKQEEITLDETVEIESPEQLLEALETPSIENYKAAIEYIASQYCNDGEIKFDVEEEDLQRYKSLLVVACLASNLIEEKELSDEELKAFNNIALNLYAKIIPAKEKVRSDLSQSHIGLPLTRIEERAMIEFMDDAQYIAMDILQQIKGNDSEGDFNDPIEEGDDPVQPLPLTYEKTSTIRTGSKKEYINAYLKIFDNIVKTKLAYYQSTLARFIPLTQRKLYKAKDEEEILVRAQEFQIEQRLATEEQIPDRTERLKANSNMVATEIRIQHAFASQLSQIFAKVKRKLADKLTENVDADDIEFDQRLLGRSLFPFTQEQHKDLIREFYSILAQDPILKAETEKYIIPPQEAVKARFKRLASGSQTLKFVQAMPVASVGKAQAIAYDLYVGEEEGTNEDFEALYEALTKRGSSRASKEVAIRQAQIDKLITADQAEELLRLLPKEKPKKNDSDSSTQLNIFDVEDEDESENE